MAEPTRLPDRRVASARSFAVAFSTASEALSGFAVQCSPRRRGPWQRLFEQIATSGDVPRELSLDSSHVKAHRSAAGAKRGVGASSHLTYRGQ
jgi:hypothetical protein